MPPPPAPEWTRHLLTASVMIMRACVFYSSFQYLLTCCVFFVGLFSVSLASVTRLWSRSTLSYGRSINLLYMIRYDTVPYDMFVGAEVTWLRGSSQQWHRDRLDIFDI